MSMFSIGLSGLNAAQNALNTTSNNISNVYTPGYNRELTILGEGRGDGGVRVNDIERQFNQYVATQLNAATSSSKALAAYEGQINQIDNLLADRDAGLAPLMQNFFSSLEDLAGAPSDPAARQGVLGTADTLSAQFRAFDSYLQDMQEGLNGQIRDEVVQINNTTEQLANLNREIALARARHGEAPNGLLNQRDRLVHELSERMDVRVNVQDGKTYQVSLPNGQPLVSGTQAYKLEVMDAPSDPQRTVLGYRDSGGNLQALPEDTVTGGTLGGLMSFRAESLDKAQNQLGQLAVSLAAGFNEQHRLGVDLNGEQGGDLFAFGDPVVYANDRNTGDASVSASFDPNGLGELRAADYTVRILQDDPDEDAHFEVIRKDTGEVVEATFDSDSETLTFGGVQLEFSGDAEEGDRFEVQPVRRVGANLESMIGDLDKIAAGSLVDTTGDLPVAGLRADSGALASEDLPWNVEVTQDNGDGTFNITVTDSDGNETDYDGVEPGDDIAFDGITLFLGEELSPGQEMTIDRAASGTGDNRNALALQGLQDSELVGGGASLNQAYASMVSDVGNRTNVVQVNLEARQGLTEQLKAVQQSESGVNLDEEAANLIRYQQFYMANARVIDTASNIFDTILGLRN